MNKDRLFNLYKEIYNIFKGKVFNVLDSDNKTLIKDNDISHLSRFTLMEGVNYDHQSNIRMLLVGRAPNGWGENLAVSDDDFAHGALDEYSLRHFDWVEKENGMLVSKYLDSHGSYITYKLAAFFTYAEDIFYRLTNIIPNENEKWLDYIAWSNLYKISPPNTGNPEGEMEFLQRDICKRILLNDIELCNPTHILFFTGYENMFEHFHTEFPNVKYIGKNCSRGKNKNDIYVEAAGTYKDAKVVVCCRPEYRNKEQLVSDVIKYFNIN